MVRRLVGDGPGDGLADPPGGVGGELEALRVVELVDRPHEAEVALLDQVEEGQATVAVALGDGDHQAQVGFDELVLGLLALAHQATIARQVARPSAGRRPALLHARANSCAAMQAAASLPDFDRLRDLHLERRVEERDPTDLLEIGVDRVLRAAR